jgi:protein gp37
MNLNKGEFWDTTETAFRGCSHASPGCEHCWAERFAWRHVNNPKTKALYDGLATASGWTGETRYNPNWWVRLSEVRKPQRVFFNGMGDLFHSNNNPAAIRDCLARISKMPQHLFIAPTKRPEIAALHIALTGKHQIPNLILLTSVEDQDNADKRIPYIIQCRPYGAAVGAICEPLLGHIEIGHHLAGLDWVLAGGENGHQARFMHPFAAGKIASDCEIAHVPFFFKQWGRQQRGRLLGGDEHNGGPKIWAEWK